MKINIGRTFLRLIDKHSPRHHIQVISMPNMTSVIRNHNASLLKDPVPTDIKECSCCRKTECLLDKKCLSECQVFNASVDSLNNNETKHYHKTYEKNFKERYNNYTGSFKNKCK